MGLQFFSTASLARGPWYSRKKESLTSPAMLSTSRMAGFAPPLTLVPALAFGELVFDPPTCEIQEPSFEAAYYYFNQQGRAVFP